MNYPRFFTTHENDKNICKLQILTLIKYNMNRFECD